MDRPAVSVVMPFAGDLDQARRALASLSSLDTEPGDEVIFVDNGEEPDQPALLDAEPGVLVVRAAGERSPAHARNTGASRASNPWILFLDADCDPRPRLIAAYFASTIAVDVGALAGEVLPAAGARGLVSRYGSARSFLGQAAHLAHPYMPRAAAANLLVRREAFEQVGGFFEGLRAAEDTDFTWRLQTAGWRLELRSEAWAWHRYRSTLAELRRQWRSYAAGRAWLARRYEGFHPQPALVRAFAGGGRRSAGATTAPAHSPEHPGPLTRVAFAFIDAVLAVEELVGFTLSNRPAGVDRAPPGDVVALAQSFPLRDDPLVELTAALEGVRVEAVRRPEVVDNTLAGRVPAYYVEDEGAAARLVAAAWLMARHPLRGAFDLLRRGPGQPSLRALGPVVRRLEGNRRARVLALGGAGARSTPARIARLAGRRLDELPRPPRRPSVRRQRSAS